MNGLNEAVVMRPAQTASRIADASERKKEIPIDVHFGDPVAQAVHHELHRAALRISSVLPVPV